jgi:hypothetical protein
VSASCGATYSAVEKRRSGDVFRKAKVDGSAARARAPSSIFVMMLGDVLLEVMFAMCSFGVAATGCLSH